MTTLAFAVLLLAASVHSAPPPLHSDTARRDCTDNTAGLASGVFTIQPVSKFSSVVQVYCDMDTDGGKWTVIQRRIDGTVNFFRPWAQYKAGFGRANGEYWLGLEAMHVLTWGRKHELRVDMEDFQGNKVFAQYSSFSVGSEAHGYKLHVTGFKNGGAGDSLSYHNGAKFTTFDKDQDTYSENCARLYDGGFWFKKCLLANINGVYKWGKTKPYEDVVTWTSWKGFHYSLKALSMKIRPVS